MRSDVMCLFWALSSVFKRFMYVFIRDYIINHLKNAVENRPVHEYANQSRMQELGTWRTDVEIKAMADKLETSIYVYCQYVDRYGKPHFK